MATMLTWDVLCGQPLHPGGASLRCTRPAGHGADVNHQYDPQIAREATIGTAVAAGQVQAAGRTVFVAMVNERHSTVEPYLFATEQAAVDFAKDQAQQYASDPGDIEESPIEGWLYHCSWGPEGDAAWVLAREVEQ